MLPKTTLPQHVEQTANPTGLLQQPADQAAHQILLTAAVIAAAAQHRTENPVEQTHVSYLFVIQRHRLAP